MSLLHDDQRRILQFIERYQARHGRTPSYEEIRRGTGMRSKDHVYRDVQTLEHQKYLRREHSISRGITLLRTADGYPVTPNGFSIPVLDLDFCLNAPANPSTRSPRDWIEVTRALIPEAEGVYAIRIQGDTFIDALVHDGDTIVLKKQASAADGELVALTIKNSLSYQLLIKRLERGNGWVWLHPEDPLAPSIQCKIEDIEIKGSVLCIIRNITSGTQSRS